MYGFINCCLYDLTSKVFGEEKWKEAVRIAGVDLAGGEFLIHKIYSDKETVQLILAVSQISGMDLNAVLERFGQHFFQYCVDSGYDSILRVLGRNLREFLGNLDALHDHLASIYPGMNAPSFRTTERPDGGLDLHYYSSREGLEYIVIGIVKTVARDVLNTTVEVTIKQGKTQASDHVVFTIHEKKDGEKPSEFPPPDKLVGSLSLGTQKVDTTRCRSTTCKKVMTVRSFTKAFPFHVVFDRNLCIRQCGTAVSKYVDPNALRQYFDRSQAAPAKQSSFLDTFRLVRPKMKFSFKAVLSHINTVFVVATRSASKVQKAHAHGSTSAACPSHGPRARQRASSGERDFKVEGAFRKSSEPTRRLCPHATRTAPRPKACSQPSSRKTSETEELRLKGQMIYLPSIDCILFLCSPRVSNFEELARLGIFISDMPLHDVTRELILKSQVHQQDRELVKKHEITTDNLRKMQVHLIEKKKQTDDLLLELLPDKVASMLRLNMPVPAEKYDLVTILFTDIVGFTALCSDENVVPMDVTRMLNKLYTIFDMLTVNFGVYKVETIGDAYMVASGLPTPCQDHADRLAQMACNMVELVAHVLSPADNLPIKIRVGLHSGPVMAGVVGQKMPRYCLFGGTVSVANKMESGSVEGKVNVSEDTRSFLDPHKWLFFKNEKANLVPSYFLERNPGVNGVAKASDLYHDLCVDSRLLESPTRSPVLRKQFNYQRPSTIVAHVVKDCQKGITSHPSSPALGLELHSEA